MSFPRSVDAAALDPNGSVLAVAFKRRRPDKSTSAELLDARTGGLIRLLPESGIRSFAFSPDGKLLASGSYDLTARLWSASAGQLVRVLPHKGYACRRPSPATARRS